MSPDVLHWFPKKILDILRPLGFTIGVYEVKDKVVYGARQVFIPKRDHRFAFRQHREYFRLRKYLIVNYSKPNK